MTSHPTGVTPFLVGRPSDHLPGVFCYFPHVAMYTAKHAMATIIAVDPVSKTSPVVIPLHLLLGYTG